MTCIAAIEHDGFVTIGGDSAASTLYDGNAVGSPKVFQNGPYVMGYTSSFRMGQLLQHSFQPPYHDPKLSDEKFMVTAFMDSVRKCFESGGYIRKEGGQEEGGTFLVGYRGQLYRVDSDFQITRPLEGFSSVGSGFAYALGSLHSTAGHDNVNERLEAALESAAYFAVHVRGPFHYITLTPGVKEPKKPKKVKKLKAKKKSKK